MKERIKSALAVISISILVNGTAKFLGSDYLSNFLPGNIVLILITLLAINITTMSVIMTRIKEIMEKFGGNFSESVSEMEYTLKEQLSLIILAVFILVLKESPLVQTLIPHHAFMFSTILTAIFIYAIDILHDIGQSIFQIIRFDQQVPKDK